MEDVKMVVCRLCLGFVNFDESQILDTVSKDILKIIVPQVDLDASDDPKICQTCYKTILRCYKFKSSINKEDKCEIKKDADPSQVHTDGPHVQQIEIKCEFCSASIDKESLAEFDYRKIYFNEVLQKCLPEWNLSNDSNKVPCKQCLETLTDQYTFIGNCLDTEDKLLNYRLTREISSEVKINLYEAIEFILGRDQKAESLSESDSGTSYSEFCKKANEPVPFPDVKTENIKMEVLDIKAETLEQSTESEGQGEHSSTTGSENEFRDDYSSDEEMDETLQEHGSAVNPSGHANHDANDPEEVNPSGHESCPRKLPRARRNEAFCVLCKSTVINFARHIYRHHSDHADVQGILSHPKGSKQRHQLLTLLRKKGNYVSDPEEGKPVRTSSGTTDYLPCINCLGFYSSKYLCRHRKHCLANPKTGNPTGRTAAAVAQNFLLSRLKVDPDLREKIFPRMRADRISLVAKKDALICAFGAKQLKLHKDKKHFLNTISRKMRELSRLLLEVRALAPSIINLVDVLKPQHYDLLVRAAKNAAKYDSDKEFCQSPTYTANICTSLKQCCGITLINARKKAGVGAAETETDVEALRRLIVNKWRHDIPYEVRPPVQSKITVISLACDLNLLRLYIKRKTREAIEALRKDHTDQQAYIRLVESVYCRLFLLNRKSTGDLSRFSLSVYTDSLRNAQPRTGKKLPASLTQGQKILMNNFKQIWTTDEPLWGRGFPVLFSREVECLLEILLQYRLGIVAEANPYLFAHPRTNQFIEGCTVLLRFARLSGAKRPGLMNCTQWTKYIATLMQLYSLGEREMEEFTMSIDHIFGVNVSSYVYTDDVYRTAKLSKLLSIDKDIDRFRGKTFDEIDVDLEEDLTDIKDEYNVFDLMNVPQSGDNEMDVTEPLFSDLESVTVHTGETEIRDVSDTSVEDAVVRVKKGKRRTLTAWTEEQKKIATDFFKEHIRESRPPKRRECDEMRDKYSGVFANKDWLKIKVFIQNVYTKVKNKKKWY